MHAIECPHTTLSLPDSTSASFSPSVHPHCLVLDDQLNVLPIFCRKKITPIENSPGKAKEGAHETQLSPLEN